MIGGIGLSLADLARVPEYSLIDETFEEKLERVLEEKRRLYYEETDERASLSPSDPETLHARTLCAELVQLERLIEDYFRGNLIAYSRGTALDNLAANKMVFRQGAKAAECMLRFWASDYLNRAISVSAGTRVRSEDDVTFYTAEYAEILPRGSISAYSAV